MNDPSAVVLDASALLCLIFSEPGADRVEAVMNGAMISAINYAEVKSKLIDRGVDPDEVETDLADLDLDVVPFDRDLADFAARLRPMTRSAGLSLGDRCCLALAKHRGARAITTDRAWGMLGASTGVEIETVR